MNVLRVFFFCIANDWISRNPFYNYKCRTKEVDRPFLSQEEIDSIINKNFPINRLTQVRDVFIFCCYTGLAYADVHKLRSNHIGMGADGKRWIFVNRTKTDTRASIPILPIAASIVELIYSLHSAKVINDGSCDISNLVALFEQMVNFQLTDSYRTYVDIKNRAKPTKFIDALKVALHRRIEEDEA